MRAAELRFGGVRLDSLRKVLRQYGPYLRGSRAAMWAALACSLGAVAMQLLRPWPLKLVFDAVLVDGQRTGALASAAWLARFTDQQLLAGLCAALLAVSLLWGGFAYGQALWTARAGHALVHALRQAAHGHLQRLSLNFHHKHQHGDLLMRLTGDISALRDLLVNATVMGLSAVLLLAAMLAVLAAMDPWLTLVVMALLPPLAITTFRFSSEIRIAAQRQRRIEGRVAGAVSETLRSVRMIQAFGQEALQDKRFAKNNRRSLRAGLRTTRLEASLARVIEVLLAAGTAGVFWYGVRRVQGGVLSPGDLLVFISYAQSSFKPLRRLARSSSRMAKAMVCARRVRELLKEVPEVKNRPGAKSLRRGDGRIELSRVSFRYPGHGRALHRVSFTVEPGTFVGIVGPSGAGKSTLIALLLRLYEPTRGKIRLSGKDITRYTIGSVRRQMAVVLQEPLLFGDSIRANIAFGRPGATNEEIERAAELALVLEFARDLPEGLDTSLAEAGSTLSAGQRQRIAVARAFLRRAPLLLLDEPTNGLDAVSEIKVMSSIERLMTRATTLMVAHKLAAVQNADRVLVVRRGRIDECGTHQELLRTNGWYAQTWRAQASEYPAAVVPFPTARRRWPTGAPDGERAERQGA